MVQTGRNSKYEMQNKANSSSRARSVPGRASKEVSSLKFHVSSGKGQASSLPTSNFTLDTSNEPPYRVTASRGPSRKTKPIRRACWMGPEDRVCETKPIHRACQPGPGGLMVQNKANFPGLSTPRPRRARRDDPTVQNKANLPPYPGHSRPRSNRVLSSGMSYSVRRRGHILMVFAYSFRSMGGRSAPEHSGFPPSRE